MATVPDERSPPQTERVALPGPANPMSCWHVSQRNFSTRNTSIPASVIESLGVSVTLNLTCTAAVGTMKSLTLNEATFQLLLFAPPTVSTRVQSLGLGFQRLGISRVRSFSRSVGSSYSKGV